MVVVDTSAWIEWLVDSPTGQLLKPVFPGKADCIVPTIVQLELSKWLYRECGEEKADQAIAYTETCRGSPLDTRTALLAAELHRQYKLATADAVVNALERMLAMRAYQRAKHVDGTANHAAIDQVKLSVNQVEEMYRVMAIANYEDRFVIPTTHREYAENAFNVRGGCGFSFGNGCSEGVTETSLFGSEKKRTIPIKAGV